MSHAVVVVFVAALVFVQNIRSGKSVFLRPHTATFEKDSGLETLDDPLGRIVVTDQSGDPAEVNGFQVTSDGSKVCESCRNFDRKRRKRSVDEDLPDSQMFGFNQKYFFQPDLISKLNYRPFPGSGLKQTLNQDSSFQNLFDFNNGYRFPVRVGHPEDDDFDPDVAKRALVRDKMIRLYRRDGLKVLRLRRNEAGSNLPDKNPEEEKPEKEAEVVPEKRWTHQEKQRYHFCSSTVSSHSIIYDQLVATSAFRLVVI